MAVLRQVENGSVSLAAGSASQTVTLGTTLLDTTKAFLVFGIRPSSPDPKWGQIKGVITNTTTLTFSRWDGTSSPAITIEWYVAEFTSGVTVQRGELTPSGTTNNVTISAVTLAKAVPLVSITSFGSNYGGDDYCKAKITTTTNLEIFFQSSASSASVGWQVIEFTDATVQTGDIAFGTGDASLTATPTSVDTTKAWLVHSVSGNITVAGQVCMRGVVTNATTLTFDRSASGTALNLTWYLVEFTDATTVQHGSVNFTTAPGDTTKDVTLTAVDTTKTIVAGTGLWHRGGRAAILSDDPTEATATYDLTTTTNLRIQRGATTVVGDLTYAVIEFPTGAGGNVTGTASVTPGVFTSSASGTVSAATYALDTWHQAAGNPHRTGASTVTPSTPWRYLYSINGPDELGTSAGHTFDVPAEAFPVCGNGRLYAPQGGRGLACYDLDDGALLWRFPWATVAAAPVYDSAGDYVLFPDTAGFVWRLAAATGDATTKQSCYTGSSVVKALLLAGTSVYASCEDGSLQKIAISTMARTWRYAGGASAGSRAETPPTYSTVTSKIIYVTADGYVHAVTDSSGAASWRVKPGTQTAGELYTYDGGWPVVADNTGIVLVRNVGANIDQLQTPNGSNVTSPTGDAATVGDAWRTWLVANAQYQHTFALNLSDGTQPFVPAVGNLSVERTLDANSAADAVGSMPAVKVHSNDDEVAYLQIRSGDQHTDPHRDAAIGEMVLGATMATRLSMARGDLRYLASGSNYTGRQGYIRLIDEACPITALGDHLYHAHWMGSEGITIVDRGDGNGSTFADPITTTDLPAIMRGKDGAGTFNSASHYCPDNGTDQNTARGYTAPVYWVYWDEQDPPGSPRGLTTYSAGIRPRITFVHKQYLIVSGNGGDITVFRHSGTVSGVAAPAAPTALTLTGPTTGPELVASDLWTVAFNDDSILASGTVTVTLSDGGAGGTFKNQSGATITTLALTQVVPAARFTYTPDAGSGGTTITISLTNDGGLANP